jgi:hypothetical protein
MAGAHMRPGLRCLTNTLIIDTGFSGVPTSCPHFKKFGVIVEGGGLLLFIFGSMVGIVPWILILIYFLRPGSASDVAAPGFVVGIVISLFVFFNTFAINQWLQYKQVGKWKSYLQGERTYITLSLVAKTALAWQAFSGAIIPAIAG